MQNLQDRIERINRWKKAFADETTGIRTTVQDLLWNYAAFQTTVQIVHLSSEGQDGGRTLNQMLFDLIHEGYWSSLLLGTRRLLDKTPLKGERGVYSIRSLVNDVKSSQVWLTRKIYVEYVHGAVYDSELLHFQLQEEIAAKKGPVWGSKKIIYSDAAHKCFDELSGKAPTDRGSDDLIDPAVFSKIEARLSSLDKIADHVSTHVAHSGNEESRQSRRALDGFDIHEARSTLKQIKEISTLVGIWFANEGTGDLATFLGDQFEGLDQPIVRSSEIQKLEQHWQEIDRDIAKWSISPKEL